MTFYIINGRLKSRTYNKTFKMRITSFKDTF